MCLSLNIFFVSGSESVDLVGTLAEISIGKLPVFSSLYPEDLWTFDSPDYIEYLSNRDKDLENVNYIPTATSTTIRELLENGNLMQAPDLKNWILLETASPSDALTIIESPLFNASNLKYINELPLTYFKKRQLKLFTIFLRRFRYVSEAENLNVVLDHKFVRFGVDVLPTIYIINKITAANDPDNPSDTDPFIKAILETQKTAFICYESGLIDSWLAKSVSHWRFITFYCEIPNLDIKALTTSVAAVLFDLTNYNVLTEDKFRFISTLPNFSVATEISCLNQYSYTFEYAVLSNWTSNWTTTTPLNFKYVKMYFEIFSNSESKSRVLFTVILACEKMFLPKLIILVASLPNLDPSELYHFYEDLIHKINSEDFDFPEVVLIESLLFKNWLEIGPAAWMLFKVYFESVKSITKSESLIKILVRNDCFIYLLPIFIRYILDLPNFDINCQFHFYNTNVRSSFLTVILSQTNLSKALLPQVLEHPKLNILTPSGFFYTNLMDNLNIESLNYSYIFVATVSGNNCAIPQVLNSDVFNENTSRFNLFFEIFANYLYLSFIFIRFYFMKFIEKIRMSHEQVQ